MYSSTDKRPKNLLIDFENKMDDEYFEPHIVKQQSTSKTCQHPKQDNEDDDDQFNATNNSFNHGTYFENYIAKNIPVFILVTIKLLTQHITGFLIIIACFVGSRCANDRVKLFDRRSVNGRSAKMMEAVSVISLLLINEYLLYKVILKEDGGSNVLLFKPISEKYADAILTVFWLILISQFFIQLVEITLKATLSLLKIPFNKRGYSYNIIKNLLTLYRWILPMPQICAYLWSINTVNNVNRTWFSILFDILLIIIYLVFKLYMSKDYAVNLYKSIILIFKPVVVGSFISESAIIREKLCPVTHLPFNSQNYGERPVNITNASGIQNVVSEGGLYTWLNLQTTLSTALNNSANPKCFICPITGENLKVNDETDCKNYLSSCDTNFHIFLM